MGFGSVNVGYSPEGNVPGGVVVLGSDGKIPDALIPDGYATLGSDGKLAESQRWEIDAYTKEETDQKIEDAAGQAGPGIPAGNIGWFAGATPPDGWMVCNGAAVSRATYAALFAVLGTTYGEGDGETTFVLPDLRDRVAWGGTAVGTYKHAGLPAITGSFWAGTYKSSTGLFPDKFSPSGVFSIGEKVDWQYDIGEGEGSTSMCPIEFKLETPSPYGESTTVQPPALVLLPCIKY